MSNFTDVKTFMKTFGQIIRTKAEFPDNKTMQLRYDLIKEELDELEEAMKAKDLKEIALMKSKCGESGIIIVGGGVPKNYSQDSVIMAEMLGFDVNKHKFGIQISTADIRDGGLSGSTIKEAISWGKNDKGIEDVMIWGEASVFFPLLVNYIFQKTEDFKIKEKKLNNIFKST